jgi:hypothetical protein
VGHDGHPPIIEHQQRFPRSKQSRFDSARRRHRGVDRSPATGPSRYRVNVIGVLRLEPPDPTALTVAT